MTAAAVSREQHPHGAWIWNLSRLPNNYLTRLKQRSCRRVYLKVFDDASRHPLWEHQCNVDVIESFSQAGIEVWGWGYHFDHRYMIDIREQSGFLGLAFQAGIKGYIFDVEAEVKVRRTHGLLQSLIERTREHSGDLPIGYTSFGHPGFHSEVPYKMLNDTCDLQFPQIYAEKYTFGPGAPSPAENRAEIAACLLAHRTMGLTKPILPIFSSESDATYPMTAREIQSLFADHPGASLWRVPNAGERGVALDIHY